MPDIFLVPDNSKIIDNLRGSINHTHLSYNIEDVFPDTKFYMGNNGKKYIALDELYRSLNLSYTSEKLRNTEEYLRKKNEGYVLRPDKYDDLDIVVLDRYDQPCTNKQLISEAGLLLFLSGMHMNDTLHRCLMCMFNMENK